MTNQFLICSFRARPLQVRKQGLVKDLTPGSWEEEMTAHCRSRLAVKPKKAAAALFYSQHPDGTEKQALD